MNKKIVLTSLAIILILGFLYRVHGLGHDSFWIDESYTIVAAKNIGEFGRPGFESGHAYLRAWPQSYVLYGIGSVFGFGHVPMRFFSVFVGLCVVVLAYFLGKELYDRRVGLLSAALFSLSYWQIAWSRQARMYIFVEAFFLLSMYQYARFLKNGSLKSLIWSGVWVIIGSLFHPSILLLVVVFGVHYVLLKNKRLLVDVKAVLARARPWHVLAGVGVLMTVLYYSYERVKRLGLVADYWGFYQQHILSEQYLFLFLALFGLVNVKKKFSSGLLLVLAMIGMFAVFSYGFEMINLRYVFIAMGLMLILAAQGVVSAPLLWKSGLMRKGVLLVLVVLVVFSGFVFWPKENYPLERGTPQPPFEQAYEYVVMSGLSEKSLIATQPAVAELYLRKPDFWLAISYEGRSHLRYFDNETLVEHYTGTQTLVELPVEGDWVLVIDDMGLNRLGSRGQALEQWELQESFGDRFWSRVYVFTPKNI